MLFGLIQGMIEDMGEAASFFEIPAALCNIDLGALEAHCYLLKDAITPLCINLFIHLVAFDFDAGRAKNVKSKTIQKGLVVLAELYNFMEELLQSTQTQQALLHHQDGKIVEEELSIVDQLHCLMLVPALGTKGSSLISKLKPKRLVFSSSNKELNKNNDGVVADLNIALCSLLGREKNGGDSINSEVQGALRVLETLIADLDGLEGGLNCMFRCLARNRVSFLNMLLISN
ncbi:hypothetical protein Ahy_B09g098830 isoform A [Arachis hypogaea]|uniref:Uncharacterized protein n=1 Tax=Arachis hypogaea TaxID=3818 RepID=A0A444XT19_ARAHY|nr:hypothetical protein Ahy_B09g098830 isoform A [Arachis hypogaea]